MANSKKNKQTKIRKVNKTEMTTSSDQKENRPKSKKITLASLSDGIAMSKQLLLMKTKNLRNRRPKPHDETRICGNGIPLPPLAELEKMYEDSDEELSSLSTLQENSTTTESTQKAEPQATENKLLSPTTIQQISDRWLNIISDISDPSELLKEIVPPPPVIPQKKRKKPEEPYIVGCKERPKVVNKPSTNFCKGDEDYGVDASNAEPDSPPRKRAKKSKIPSYSKSIFNAKSDEIAENLAKINDHTEETNYDSSDSNKTIEYVPPKLLSPTQPTFSPLPSTSRDSETFIKNDELFNQSLREGTLNDETTTPEATPNETIDNIPTIVIDDDEDDNDDEIIQIPQQATQQDMDLIIENPEDSISIQNSAENNNQNNLNVINDHDAYIDITDTNDYNTDEDTIDVDVDVVIAQNQAILSKFNRNNELNPTITTVEATTSTDDVNTLNDEIVNNQNGNNEMNNTVTTPVQPTLNVNQNIPPHPNSMPEATIPLSLNSVRSSSPTAHHQHGQPRATRPSSLHLGRSIPATNNRPRLPMPKMASGYYVRPIPNSSRVTHPYLDVGEEPFILLKTSGPSSDTITTLHSSLLSTSRNLSGPALEQIVTDFFRNGPSAAAPPTNTSMPEVRTTEGMQNNIVRVIKKFACQCASRLTMRSPSKPQKTTPVPNTSPSLDAPRNIGECPICMDQFSTSNGIASTICGHVFCLTCIQAATRVNGRRCPTCRKVLKGGSGGYHQIYL